MTATLDQSAAENTFDGVRHKNTEYEPLGPDSLTWQTYGHWTGMLGGLWAGSLQNMHPKLGAAVWEHSDFFTERWERLLRSLYPIAGVVFDGGTATGHQVRDYHLTIKGEMPDGSRYHALDPDVFYWAHATFWYGNLRRAEWLGVKLTEADKRQLFEESKAWYAMYGISMRPVPDTYEDFLEYWDHMCRNVLRDHPAVRTVLDISQLGPPPFLSLVPDWLWFRFLMPRSQKNFDWLTTGAYDPAIRELMGLKWSEKDEKRYRRLGKVLGFVAYRLVPKRMMRHPRPRDGWDRVEGRIPAGTPPVETPMRNMPPESEWDNPMHYCPVNAARRADRPLHIAEAPGCPVVGH